MKGIFFNYVDWTLEDVPRPFYVGKGKLPRVQLHERNAYWKNIATKFGWRREIVLATKDEQFAFEEEKRRIAVLGTFEDGTPGRWGANLTEGGEGPSGRKHSQERKDAISAFMRQRKREPLSQESKERISIALKGKPSSKKGQKTGPLSSEHREKIATHHRGLKRGPYKKQAPRSKTHCENLSASLLGKPKTAEHREKLRQAALKRHSKEEEIS